MYASNSRKLICATLSALLVAGWMSTTALAVEMPLTQAWSAMGNYGTVHAGVGTLLTDGTGTISGVTVPGTVTKAFLYWVGRNGPATDLSSDPTITLTRSGDAGISVTADVMTDVSLLPYWNHNHIAFIADVTDYVAAGTFDYMISDFHMSSAEYGVGLQIVYEDAGLPETEVSIFQGHDFAYRNWAGPEGLDVTSVVNYTFEPTDHDRVLDLAFIVAGGEATVRSEQLWFATGTHDVPGDLPTELVTSGLGTVLDSDPLVAGDGQTWDTWTGQIVVPAGSTYASFQFESGGGSNPSIQPESFSWVSASFQLGIPEPATLAFFTFGTVIVIRSRRRG